MSTQKNNHLILLLKKIARKMGLSQRQPTLFNHDSNQPSNTWDPEFKPNIAETLIAKMQALQAIFKPKEPSTNTCELSSGAFLNPEDKALLVEIASHYRCRFVDGGAQFSVLGEDSLSAIAQAQMVGFPLLSYSLRCKTKEEALRLLTENSQAVLWDEKCVVNISVVLVDKTHYHTAKFLDSETKASHFDSNSEDEDKNGPTSRG